jgi:hypothetical protein
VVINIAPDLLGRLWVERVITDRHHDAARTFQALRAAYHEQLGTRGFRSCLDVGVGGYDTDDGDPDVIRAYRRLERAVPGPSLLIIAEAMSQPYDARPGPPGMLRAALDKLVAAFG